MPEWVTHAVVGFAVAVALGIRSKSLTVAGSILPDLLQKLAFPAAYLIGASSADAIFGIAHTPIFSFLISLAIACLLPGKLKQTLFALCAGWISHYALDALQGPFGQTLLWPFSNAQYGLFLWHSDSPIPLATTLTALAAYATWKVFVKKEKLF